MQMEVQQGVPIKVCGECRFCWFIALLFFLLDESNSRVIYAFYREAQF